MQKINSQKLIIDTIKLRYSEKEPQIGSFFMLLCYSLIVCQFLYDISF